MLHDMSLRSMVYMVHAKSVYHRHIPGIYRCVRYFFWIKTLSPLFFLLHLWLLARQAEVVLAWQKVVSTVHTAAVLFREDNVKLLASNAALEAEKRNIIGQNIDLKDRVSVLIADRDRLAAKLQEQGEGSTAEIPGNGNSNSNDNCIDCTTLAGQLDVSSATPSIATTIIKRASAVAAAAPDAAFATSAPSPTIASDTATGQSGSTFTTVAEMDAGTTTTTMKMAPRQAADRDCLPFCELVRRCRSGRDCGPHRRAGAPHHDK